MDAQLGAESPADVRGDHLNALWIDPQRAGDRGAGGIDDLRADIDDQVIAARHRQAGVRLHRLGELIRRRVTLIDLDRGAGSRRRNRPPRCRPQDRNSSDCGV